jgi:hypothetical protein
MSEEVHILLGMIPIIFYKAIGGGSQQYPKVPPTTQKLINRLNDGQQLIFTRADFLAIGERNVEATMIIARMHPTIGWKLDGNSMARVVGLEFYGNFGPAGFGRRKAARNIYFRHDCGIAFSNDCR